TDTIVSMLRPCGRSNGQSSVDSYGHTSQGGDTESITDGNSGIERSNSRVSVTRRTCVSSTTITKGPAAGCRTNAAGCRSDEVDQSTNLCQIRTGCNGNSQLRINGQ